MVAMMQSYLRVMTAGPQIPLALRCILCPSLHFQSHALSLQVLADLPVQCFEMVWFLHQAPPPFLKLRPALPVAVVIFWLDHIVDLVVTSVLSLDPQVSMEIVDHFYIVATGMYSILGRASQRQAGRCAPAPLAVMTVQLTL
jgi:hypothetical protein